MWMRVRITHWEQKKMINKYRNKKVGSHDSKAESRFSKVLRMALPECSIVEKETIELIPKFKSNGQTIRSAKLIPDFTIYYKGEAIAIIDVKGFQTDKSKLQFKLLRYLMHIANNPIYIDTPVTAADRLKAIATIKEIVTLLKKNNGKAS